MLTVQVLYRLILLCLQILRKMLAYPAYNYYFMLISFTHLSIQDINTTLWQDRMHVITT